MKHGASCPIVAAPEKTSLLIDRYLWGLGGAPQVAKRDGCYILPMGMHDRDYYRQDYAKKNGMVYNARKARYSPLAWFKRTSIPTSALSPVKRGFWFWLQLLVGLVLLLKFAIWVFRHSV